MRNLVAGIFATLSFWVAVSAHAAGLFGVPDYNFEKYCALNAPRSTVVYIDQASIVPDGNAGMPHWVEQLRAKVESSLMPGERLSIVKIASADGGAQQVWSGCYPGLPPQQEGASSGMLGKFSALMSVKRSRSRVRRLRPSGSRRFIKYTKTRSPRPQQRRAEVL